MEENDLMTGEQDGSDAGEEQDSTSDDQTTQQDGDQTDTDDQSDDQSSEEDGETEDEGAPDEYAEFTLPDGVEMDTAALEAFSPQMKELNLTQEQAQSLVDKFAEMRQAEAEGWVKQIQDRNDQWHKDLKADTEFGGDKLRGNSVKVNNMLTKFDPDGELVADLKKEGRQNWPALFKFISRMHPHFSDDVFFGGDNTSGKRGEKPAHEKMGWKPINEY